MTDIYASLDGRTGRIRQRHGKPLAGGVRRASRLKSGRYRVVFSEPQPDTTYIVGISVCHGFVGAVTASTPTRFEVVYSALDGAPLHPDVVNVSVHRIGQASAGPPLLEG